MELCIVVKSWNVSWLTFFEIIVWHVIWSNGPSINKLGTGTSFIALIPRLSRETWIFIRGKIEMGQTVAGPLYELRNLISPDPYSRPRANFSSKVASLSSRFRRCKPVTRAGFLLPSSSASAAVALLFFPPPIPFARRIYQVRREVCKSKLRRNASSWHRALFFRPLRSRRTFEAPFGFSRCRKLPRRECLTRRR